MTNNRRTSKSIEPAKLLTVFEVRDGGTLCMADFHEAETRAEFYDSVAGFWSDSPKDLADAMSECQPLAWAVHSIYSDFRDELSAELERALRAGNGNKQLVDQLKARLQTLREEPEEGAVDWLLSLGPKDFEERVVPVIEAWFGEPPNWNFEDDYLPDSGTAQGAALEFFRDMTTDELEILGVDIVEGEHPGSTYYAAELRGDIDESNRAAEAADIPVRFVAGKD